MNIRQLIAIFTLILLFISSALLNNIIDDEYDHISITSQPRFTALLIIHIMIIMYTVVFIKISELERYLRIGFFMSSSIAAIMIFTEAFIYKRRDYYGGINFNLMVAEPLEKIYLSIYFGLLFLSPISFIILAMSLVWICYHNYIRSKRMGQAVLRSIQTIQYSSELADTDCSICLAALTINQPISQIPCGHIFHQSCIKEWVKINSICPNCRYNLFLNVDEQHLNYDVGIEQL